MEEELPPTAAPPGPVDTPAGKKAQSAAQKKPVGPWKCQEAGCNMSYTLKWSLSRHHKEKHEEETLGWMCPFRGDCGGGDGDAPYASLRKGDLPRHLEGFHCDEGGMEDPWVLDKDSMPDPYPVVPTVKARSRSREARRREASLSPAPKPSTPVKTKKKRKRGDTVSPSPKKKSRGEAALTASPTPTPSSISSVSSPAPSASPSEVRRARGSSRGRSTIPKVTTSSALDRLGPRHTSLTGAAAQLSPDPSPVTRRIVVRRKELPPPRGQATAAGCSRRDDSGVTRTEASRHHPSHPSQGGEKAPGSHPSHRGKTSIGGTRRSTHGSTITRVPGSIPRFQLGVPGAPPS